MARTTRPGADAWVPHGADVDRLRQAVQDCRGCELWQPATQAVFGDGAAPARILLVGEQPGDQEDMSGEPFIGPAGRVLDGALQEAGIPRERVYVTNAVKHFRYEQRGKRRIHRKPGVGHVDACRPWLAAELDAVRPDVIVCLGATAARAVFTREVKVGELRGRVHETDGRAVVVTTHPSAVLRMRDAQARERERAALVADLRLAAARRDGG